MIKEKEHQPQPVSIWDEFPKLKEIRPEQFPNHVWITPDGNGRYAESLALPTLSGHQQGFRTLERLLKRMRELPIKYVTIWGLSSANIDETTGRSAQELKGIMEIMQFAIESNLDDLLKNNVKFQCIGRRDRISPELVKTIEATEKLTESNDGQVLTVATDFNGETEELAIMQALINRQYPQQTVISAQMRNDLLRKYRKGLPPVDLVIRTVEPKDASAFRTSGIGDIVAQAVEVNIPKLFPNTNIEDYIDSIIKFTEIKRRFGGRPEQQERQPDKIFTLQEFKERFDPKLEEYLQQKISELEALTNDSAILDYVNYAKKIVTAEQGKRLRPYIAYLMYSVLGGNDVGRVLKPLLALEVFHAFSLVHDDIMDKESLRRGMEPVHLYIANRVKERNLDIDSSHVGISHAIVLGDLLHVFAQEILNSNTDLGDYFYQMGKEVAIGQMIDVDATARDTVPSNLIDDKIRLKTASYTFIWPAMIGAALANQNTETIKTFCKEFGEKLGIVFQTQDDLFDGESKAIQSGEEIIKTNIEEARSLINGLELSDERKQLLHGLISTIETRTH